MSSLLSFFSFCSLPVLFLPWEPHEQYEEAKWYNTERWIPQVSVYYAMGEEWRNNSKKNEEAEPKQK